MTELSLPEITLPTKLYRPQLKPHAIARRRLLACLDASLEQRVILIAAPAGFGKTVLSAQWLDGLPWQVAWLSLDEQDNALDRFVRYVIAALHTAAPGLCEAVERLLAGPVLPPAAYLADAMVAALLELNEPLVLVLDDYHTVTAESVQTLMIRLVQQLPDNFHFHLVILTRVDPPWRLTYLEGRCLSYGNSIPYHPIIDMVRDNCGITESDPHDTAVDKVHAALQEIGMEVETSAPYLLQLLGVKTAAIAGLMPETVRTRIFDTLKQMCLKGSQLRPLVFEVEDAHWIDTTSEQFLGLAGRNSDRCVDFAAHHLSSGLSSVMAR